ncbi:MAG: PHP domain-containing protein [Planctomycetes bacterium]|nr:PHP domain-containing protein [Planctomycetota bacterium]
MSAHRISVSTSISFVSFIPLLLVALCGQAAGEGSRPITGKLFHLGDNPKPHWKDFASVQPEHKTQVEIEFQSRENPKALVLEVQAGEVGMDWKVKVNDKDVGALKKSDKLFTQYFDVPPTTLKDGKNKLVIAAEKEGDDIYVGKAVLHERPLSEILGYARVHVRVRDADSGSGLPCRITVVRLTEKKEKDVTKVDEDLAEVSSPKCEDGAVRRGILYSKDGLARFELPPGDYKVYASRGFEYSMASERLSLKKHQERSVELEIRREVDTTGYLAADTHIHTKTYSGHGDISGAERVVAIAGEGVEVAVATDHNHHTDYGPVKDKVGVAGRFGSIVGNEVTTPIGHFNAFPFAKGADPPEHDHTDWVRLVQAMRGASGVRVVILNHPRRALGKESPLAQIRYNSLTGEAHRGPDDLGLSAIEILNGKTLEEDRMKTVNDWFGLLNRGCRMAAVAGSDSHSVDEVVGQTRTYVASSTDDPRRMDVKEVCDNFLSGRLLVSLGLLAKIEVDGKHVPGDLVPAGGRGGDLAVRVRVDGPTWTRADRVALYVNGREDRKEKLEPGERDGTGKVVKFEATWKVPAPRHDAYLVVVASGPAVTAPFWPVSGGDKRYLMGVTNPVWVDGDGDGKFTSAFEYASELVVEHGLKGPALEAALREHDPAVAAQFASIARARIQREAQEAYDRLMAKADQDLADLLSVTEDTVKKTFTDYLAAAPKVEVRTRDDAAEEAARLKKEDADRKKRREDRAKRRREEEEKKRKEGKKGRV